MFDEVKNMENSPERARLIGEMMDIARHDAPWVWGFFPKQFSLHHVWYKNVKPNLMANNSLKYKRIEPELRAELQTQWNRPIRWPLYTLAGLLLLVVLPAVLAYRRQQRLPAIREGR